jgi:transmembrane sensor
MKTPDKGLLGKYFNGTANRSEAEQVLNWFQTEEGARYIEKEFKYGTYSKLSQTQNTTTKKRKEEVLHNITSQLHLPDNKFRLRFHAYTRPVNAYRFVAVSILVLISMIYLLNFSLITNYGNETVTYQTGPSEVQLINLNDGTKIHLNQNSRLTLPANPEADNDITASLTGQAYFDVSSQHNRQFRVITDDTQISVLGTGFDVNTLRNSGNVTVAVTEGVVSFQSVNNSNQTILTENMVGFFDKKTGRIQEESSDTHNYLSWLHGNIVFSNTPFEQVLQQLERIFDISNQIENSELYTLRLTANFQRVSLEQVLKTIAEGLNINYTIRDGTILWSQKTD